MSSMKAPPSSAYKIVQVPEMYASIIAARGVEGGYIGGSEEESPWVPFGDNAAIRGRVGQAAPRRPADPG